MNYTQPLAEAPPTLSDHFNIQTILGTTAIGIVTLILWITYKLKGYRSQFRDLPQLPRSFVWGNMKQINAYTKPRHHPGLAIPCHVSHALTNLN